MRRCNVEQPNCPCALHTIHTGTVRDNVLFGAPYDEQRYVRIYGHKENAISASINCVRDSPSCIESPRRRVLAWRRTCLLPRYANNDCFDSHGAGTCGRCVPRACVKTSRTWTTVTKPNSAQRASTCLVDSASGCPSRAPFMPTLNCTSLCVCVRCVALRCWVWSAVLDITYRPIRSMMRVSLDVVLRYRTLWLASPSYLGDHVCGAVLLHDMYMYSFLAGHQPLPTTATCSTTASRRSMRMWLVKSMRSASWATCVRSGRRCCL